MKILIEKLRLYAETYRTLPYGREIEGTPELLDEAARVLEEAKESVDKLKKRYMDGYKVMYEGQDESDYILCPFCGCQAAEIDDYDELKPKHCPDCGTKLLY